MLSKAQDLANDCPMPLSDALNMPVTFESMYYKSKAWESQKKNIEMKQQEQIAVISRLNQLITVTAKSQSRKR